MALLKPLCEQYDPGSHRSLFGNGLTLGRYLAAGPCPGRPRARITSYAAATPSASESECSFRRSNRL